MQKYIVGISLIFIAVLMLIISFIFFKNTKIPLDNTGFTMDKEPIEVYENVFISDKVELSQGYVINNSKLDTKTLGEHQVEFLYVSEKNKKKRGELLYTVVDKTAPIVLLSNAYTVFVGYNKNLTDVILAADNYDKNPKREIIGNYDMNQVGAYPLIYQVTDQSGNTSSVSFTLYVKEQTTNNGSLNSEASYTDFNEIIKNYKTNSNKIGIDVSKWQGDIDFNALKKAGVEFVIVRIGTGLGFGKESIEDINFKQNIEGAINAEIPVGVYYYSYATTTKEAEEQAKWVIKHLKNYKIELPIAFDWESWLHFNGLEMSLYDINEVANTFLTTVEKEGYSSILYGSKYYLQHIWNTDKPVWLAHYTTNTNYEKKYLLWQLCEDGKVDGIVGPVDINILYE